MTKDWLLRRRASDNWVKFCTNWNQDRVDDHRRILVEVEALPEPPQDLIEQMNSEINHMVYFLETAARLKKKDEDATKVISSFVQ
jgi:hypothetical protein